MGVQQQLNDDLKAAMKSGDADRRDALRLLLAAIKQVEVDTQQTLDDDAILAVLTKQAKQNRESIAEYEAAGRNDLAETEKYELQVVEGYLPRLRSREEIEELVASTIRELGVSGPKATGQVMGRLMPQLQGKADGRLVNEVVREMLAA